MSLDESMRAVARSAAIAALALFGAPILDAAAAPTVDWSCHANGAFLVVAADKEDEVGQRIIVRRAAAAPKPVCSLDAHKDDMVLGDPAPGSDDMDAFYYIALEGHALLLDNGSGPGRTLTIFDLKSGKRVLDAPYSLQDDNCQPTNGCYSPDEFALTDRGVTFWRATTTAATAKNCTKIKSMQKDGFTPTIEEKSSYDFATGKLTGLKTTRCVPYQ